MSLGSGGGCYVCLWHCCLLSVPLGEQAQEEGGITQAWATWPEGASASAPNGTVKCQGNGVPEMVTPASRTTTALLVFLNLTNVLKSL